LRLGRVHLFVAFAFTVMADPVSSVAYAIQAPLRELDGDPASLVATMSLVVAIIVVISATYHQLIGRFPRGGGGPRGVAAAFGEGWAFLPLGALLVDFTLTVAVSCSAGAAAIIAYAPGAASLRLPLALALALAVAGGVLFGHRGRVGFAIATQLFLVLALVVVVEGAFADPVSDAGAAPDGSSPLFADAALAAVLLALPLGMALATGVEAPSDAIAQLPQLRDRARRLFGRLTLWAMVMIVGGLTMALAVLAVHLGIGLPDEDSTLLAEITKRATGEGLVFGGFQAASVVLLLAAAASSYLAGSGVLKALATVGAPGQGLVPGRFGRENRFLVSHWGVIAVLGVAAAMIVAAGGDEQALVQFYAVAVFASFLAATLGCARLSYQDGRIAALGLNLLGACLVAGVLGLNMTRLDPLFSLLASAAVALYLWRAWIARGRPAGLVDARTEVARDLTAPPLGSR
jgi:Amino acid permease